MNVAQNTALEHYSEHNRMMQQNCLTGNLFDIMRYNTWNSCVMDAMIKAQ